MTKTTVIAKDNEHLEKLIKEALQAEGLECDLNYIDVSQIKDMTLLFAGFPKFNGSIDRWDTSNVVNMTSMFMNTNFNSDISAWNVSNVQSMDQMFRASHFTGCIAHWNVSKVLNMHSMFRKSCFNGDISAWDVARVQNMRHLFSESLFNNDVSEWNVSSVVDFSFLFFKTTFNRSVAKWDVSNCKKFQQIFHGSTFLGDISMWSISVDSEIEDIFDFVTAHSFKEPNVYHWLLALYDHHNFSKMQATWNEHFSEYAPMASGIFATNKAAAQLIHSQWLVRNKNLNVQPGLDFNVSEI